MLVRISVSRSPVSLRSSHRGRASRAFARIALRMPLAARAVMIRSSRVSLLRPPIVDSAGVIGRLVAHASRPPIGFNTNSDRRRGDPRTGLSVRARVAVETVAPDGVEARSRWSRSPPPCGAPRFRRACRGSPACSNSLRRRAKLRRVGPSVHRPNRRATPRRGQTAVMGARPLRLDSDKPGKKPSDCVRVRPERTFRVARASAAR